MLSTLYLIKSSVCTMHADVLSSNLAHSIAAVLYDFWAEETVDMQMAFVQAPTLQLIRKMRPGVQTRRPRPLLQERVLLMTAPELLRPPPLSLRLQSPNSTMH